MDESKIKTIYRQGAKSAKPATVAPGARVLAYRYVEKDRVLVASEERYLGRTPVGEVRLSPGSYLLAVGVTGTPGIPMVNLAIEGRDADGWYPLSRWRQRAPV